MPTLQDGREVAITWPGRRFDLVRDLTWIVGRLQVLGRYREQVDRAHRDGLALEERIEQRFNMLTGADDGAV